MNNYIQAVHTQPLYARHPMGGEHAHTSQSLYMAAYACAFLYRQQISNAEQSGVSLARDVVLKLTRDLGLSMNAAAQVLHVTRATLYPWLKLERAPQAAQMKRIDKIKHGITVLESELVKDQHAMEMHAVLPTGQSIFLLLCADAVDFDQLKIAARSITQQPVVRVVDITDEELEAEPVPSKALTDLFRGMPKRKNG
jgi:predicted transcriptional regulator